MSRYVDGFVIPIPKDKIDDYRRLAEAAGKLWKEHGALDYWECLGDDLEVKDMVGFPQLANIGADETVVFSWIVFESREHRDKVNAAVMADPRIQEIMQGLAEPFDCKRMVYGGFRKMVKL
jgi:uncharacterized protein YbaA (DUF1428 family)